MLEPLSGSRRKLLLELGLVAKSDLIRAKGQVRRLARDLPAFDSIWLDALVRLGKLTPFQARILESADPERIRVGPCVLVDRLGGGPLGATFLASTRAGHSTCVIKRLTAIDRLSEEAEERLAELIESLNGLTHPGIAAPLTCERAGEELIVVSPYVDGMHLGELLVRRGRLPALVVWDLARQIVGGLAALEERGVVHGDIRAANVRLTKSGDAVLVDVGIRAAVDPELSVHSGLPPDRYDGVAPERIGAVGSPTVPSDMYALGCLLWQLLAGRPPFPGGDPLVKLAAHQTRPVADVRQWAPATPPALAEDIQRLTARTPEERPAHFAELVQRWGGPDWRGRRRLAAFRRWFDRPAPLRIERSSRSRGPRWSVLAALLVVAALAVAAMQHDGTRTVLVAWRAHLEQQAPSAADEAARASTELRAARKSPPSAESVTDASSLPLPDPEGVVRLVGGNSYRAREIKTVGPLSIVTEGPISSEVVIFDEPFRLTAETVQIDNVRIRREIAPASSRARQRGPLVQIQAQSLHVDRCVLVVAPLPKADADVPVDLSSAAAVGMEWKLVDGRDPQGGVALFRHSILIGGDCALSVRDPIRRLEFVNSLRLAGDVLAELVPAASSRSDTIVRMEQTTCRASKNLFRVNQQTGFAAQGRISVEANNCVLDVASAAGALFCVLVEPGGNGMPRVRLTGEGSLAPETLVTLVRCGMAPESNDRDDPAGVPVEGILAGPYTFAGPLSPRSADAEIREYSAPRRSTAPPGIRAADLPQTSQ